MWNPSNVEDKLLDRYLSDHPGRLFLEVAVGLMGGRLAARRIDGVLIPGEESSVHLPGSNTHNDVRAAVEGELVHVIEAKNSLHRGLIGQVVVGVGLFEKEFSAAETTPVALYAQGNPDLEWFCEQNNIHTAQYRIDSRSADSDETDDEGASEPTDIRQPPDKHRRRAFMAGWTEGEKGELYATIWEKRTHANMGNLFGWIYGEKSAEFRDTTWQRYLQHAGRECWEEQVND